jgi:hypothetical protein
MFAAPCTPLSTSLLALPVLVSTGHSSKTVASDISDIANSYADTSVTASASTSGNADHASSSVATQRTKPASSATLAGHLFIGPGLNSLSKMLQTQLELLMVQPFSMCHMDEKDRTT